MAARVYSTVAVYLVLNEDGTAWEIDQNMMGGPLDFTATPYTNEPGGPHTERLDAADEVGAPTPEALAAMLEAAAQ